jgi:hypothetical protein
MLIECANSLDSMTSQEFSVGSPVTVPRQEAGNDSILQGRPKQGIMRKRDSESVESDRQNDQEFNSSSPGIPAGQIECRDARAHRIPLSR